MATNVKHVTFDGLKYFWNDKLKPIIDQNEQVTSEAITALTNSFNDYLPLTGGTMTGTITSQSIIPTATATYSLGSSTNMFNITYTRSIDTSPGYTLNLGAGGYKHLIMLDGNVYTNAHIIPQTSNKYNLGSFTRQFVSIYTRIIDTAEDSLILCADGETHLSMLDKKISVSADIIPDYANTYNLGVEDKRWKYVYSDNFIGLTATIVGPLNITGTDNNTAEIHFSRGGYNYITAPANGKIRLCPGGITKLEVTPAYMGGYTFSSEAFYPEKTEFYSIGTPTQQYANIYGQKLYEDGTPLIEKYSPSGHKHPNYLYKTIYLGENEGDKGCLVKLNVAETKNAMISVKITGNSYGKSKPILTLIEFYNYYNTGTGAGGNRIINVQGTHFGYDFGKINIFNYDNKVCLWIPQTGNFQSFNVFANWTNPDDININNNVNVVDTIDDAPMPPNNVISNKVEFEPNKIPNSGDFLPLTGGTMTGTITSQSIIPTTTATYSLGDSSHKWKNVYAANFIENGANINTIYADKCYADYCASYLHSPNRAQFCKPGGVTLEYSTNGGSTWVDYGATDEQKIGFFSGISQSFKLGKALSTKALTTDMLRLTMDATAMGIYTSCKCLLLNVSTNGSINFNVKVEKSMKGSEDIFSTLIESQTLTGWSGWNRISIGNSFGGGDTQTWNIAKLRLTFMSDGADSSYTSGAHASILDMEVLGTTYWDIPHTMAKTGHIYSWDASGNAILPSLYISGINKNNTTAHISSDNIHNMYFSCDNVIPLVINTTSTSNPVIRASITLTSAVDLGSSSVKWRNVYANKFIGDVSGNAVGLVSGGYQNSALLRNLTNFPKDKTLFTGGWNTPSGGYATSRGTTLDISHNTYYQRLAFNTTGRIEYFRGINPDVTDGTAELSKIGDLAYLSDIPTSVMEARSSTTYDLETNFTSFNTPYICRLSSINPNLPTDCEYGNLVHFTGNPSDTAFDLLGDYHNKKLLFRSGTWKVDGTGTINKATWHQIAFTSDIPTAAANIGAAPASHTHTEYAASDHKHSANDISETLPVSKGGTGLGVIPTGHIIIGNNDTLTTVEFVAISTSSLDALCTFDDE